MKNKEDTTPKSGVFMCLDVNTYSFSSSTYGNPVGVLICLGFTAFYWMVGFTFLELLMNIMDTIHKSKPLIRLFIVYLLILQKLIRVFIVHEKAMVKAYQEQQANNLIRLGDFYTIKASGYEKMVRKSETGRDQVFHRVRYRNNSEDYFVKFLRGSITSEFVQTEDAQIKFTCDYLNTLMTQKIIPRIIISDEHVERSPIFKFYQHMLRKTELSAECVQCCNDTLLYHESTSKRYSRITSTYYLIPAITARQKTFLESFVTNFTFRRNGSPFRNIVPLNKKEILNMFKDINGLNSVNEQDLQTSDAVKRVPLGLTKTLLVRNFITGEEVEVNKETTSFKLDISKIDYEMLRPTGVTSNNKPIPKHTEAESYLEEEEDNPFGGQDLVDNQPKQSSFLEEPLDESYDDYQQVEEPKTDPFVQEELDLQLPELPPIDLETGVLNFKEVTKDMTPIQKSVLLLNHIQDDDCTIIL